MSSRRRSRLGAVLAVVAAALLVGQSSLAGGGKATCGQLLGGN